MSKKIKPGQHVIVWNPRASTRVRNCAELYEIKEEYRAEKIDPISGADGYNPFRIPRKKDDKDDRVN